MNMAAAARPSDSALLQRMLWGSVLTVATVLGTLGFACATPFAALAALAALYLPRRDAFVLIGVNWVANQVIGFALLNYPWTWDCLRGGIGLAVASLGCTGAAMLALASLRKAAFPLVVLGVFAAAFVTYEGLCFVASLGHQEGDFTLPTVLYVLYLNGLAFVGLFVLQRIARAIGVAVPLNVRQPAVPRVPAAS
jgi:hypothetical protein